MQQIEYEVPYHVLFADDTDSVDETESGLKTILGIQR